MAKLFLAIVFEIVLALGVAGVLIAIVIPLMVHADLMQPGDFTAAAIILAILTLAIAVALFRRGSAIRRHADRDT